MMRKLTAALALAIGLTSAITALAATTTTLRASPASAIVGQQVTFTASIASACYGTVTTHYFTIDGKQYSGRFSQNVRSATETLSIATLAIGTHSVTYTWRQSGVSCHGTASLTYAVTGLPSPTPSPVPSPSPSPSPPSPSPVQLTSSTAPGGNNGMLGYLGGALILLTIVSGIALAVVGRR